FAGHASDPEASAACPIFSSRTSSTAPLLLISVNPSATPAHSVPGCCPFSFSPSDAAAFSSVISDSGTGSLLICSSSFSRRTPLSSYILLSSIYASGKQNIVQYDFFFRHKRKKFFILCFLVLCRGPRKTLEIFLRYGYFLPQFSSDERYRNR